MDPNPYASPESEESPVAQSDLRQLKDDRLLVTPPKCTLPPRCVFCNAAATKTQQTGGYWWFTWTGIRGVNIKWFVCPEHKRQLQRQDYPATLIGTATLLLYAASSVHDYLLPGQPKWFDTVLHAAMPYLSGGMVLHLLIGQRLIWRSLRTPKVATANSTTAYLKHAGKPFLDSLTDGAEGYRVVDRIP